MLYTNDNGEKLHQTLIQELYNLRWYIEHLIDENEYDDDDDDEWTNPLSESNLDLPNKQEIHKVCNFHYCRKMTPEQLKAETYHTGHPNKKKPDTDEGGV